MKLSKLDLSLFLTILTAEYFFALIYCVGTPRDIISLALYLLGLAGMGCCYWLSESDQSDFTQKEESQ